VNKRGERFADENTIVKICESVNALLRQPEMLSYTLLDETIKRRIIEDIKIQGMGSIDEAKRQIRPDEVDRLLREETERGTVKLADSWEAIAGWMGADPTVLKATVEEYNAFCDKGHDALFTKDRRYLIPLRTPPFYAIRSNAVWIGTIGGIKINEKMEVLNQQDNPIPGLYAGGVDTGGWETETYNIMLSGSTFGFAVNSGRIAAEQAVEHILEKK
jgi:fumarate reductase flavoprotein subunit